MQNAQDLTHLCTIMQDFSKNERKKKWKNSEKKEREKDKNT